VRRGGGFSINAAFVRSSIRAMGYPRGRFGNLGFRCARGIER
jgi:formylglycine-generating enzyme required for sulfatase activity